MKSWVRLSWTLEALFLKSFLLLLSHVLHLRRTPSNSFHKAMHWKSTRLLYVLSTILCRNPLLTWKVNLQQLARRIFSKSNLQQVLWVKVQDHSVQRHRTGIKCLRIWKINDLKHNSSRNQISKHLYQRNQFLKEVLKTIITSTTQTIHSSVRRMLLAYRQHRAWILSVKQSRTSVALQAERHSCKQTCRISADLLCNLSG